jgi:predicted dehydrogenase
VHVLCEKPLEVTTARVKRMIDTCRDAGVVLGGIFPMRFNPAMIAVHAAAREGRFGQLATVGVTLPWWRDDAYYGAGRWQGTAALDGGGALMNQASHSIDLMQWLAAATMPNLAPDQNPVEEVYAYTAKRGHDPKRLEVEDAGVVALRFRGGALGQILASTAMWPGSLRRLVIGGRDGTAEVIEDELTTFRVRQERPDDAMMRDKLATKTKHQGGAGEALAFSHLNHQRNIADFLAALDENRDPLVTGLEATKALAIIEACYESARTGRAVSI